MRSALSQVQLSKADSKVLAQVFEPESGPAKAEVLVDPYKPADRHIDDKLALAKLKARERDAIRLIEDFENPAIQSSHSKDEVYRKALSLLDQIIEDYPDYASARNNRAQLRRWRFGDRNMLCQARHPKDSDRSEAVSATVQDLRCSIALASPERSGDAVSPAQGKLLAQVYTQLGAVCYAASKDLEEISDGEIVDEELSGWTKDAIEEEVSRMFYLGGLYGNEVAKALAVHTNPHAKLCGNIVKEAMRKELAMQS
ncbi:hypothetical protein LTR37_013223 [Vermiconidia calcicola]|uniref:Uncharacterized protein n=1 Tax=Vermiconidia calcicola TaxID=1690605 RepID=A0ACC3MWZ4_9PEZI|nr:hypothetical protein LTR37_013223 [Vermiconidia calcicola]